MGNSANRATTVRARFKMVRLSHAREETAVATNCFNGKLYQMSQKQVIFRLVAQNSRQPFEFLQHHCAATTIPEYS
jgi:hypothetical protein